MWCVLAIAISWLWLRDRDLKEFRGEWSAHC